MRVLRKFALPAMVALVLVQSSCTTADEYELFDGGNRTETWENELRDIVCDLGSLLENSGVTFLQAEELNCRVDSTDFFNDETYYPICIEKLYNFFMLKNRDFVLNDTNTIHTPAFVLRGMVSNVINNQKDYDLVRLSWLLGEKKFETIAAFDKSNGQIVYDNILTNIPWSQVELPSKKSRLTRAENGGTETKIFYKEKMEITEGSKTFELWVKGICSVTVSRYGNYYNPVFSTVKINTAFPPNRSYDDIQYYPYADAVAANNAIYFYLWVGIDQNTFINNYGNNSDRVDVCEKIYDVFTGPKYNWPDSTDFAACYENIPTTMGNGLFEPEPSPHPEWNF